MNLIGGDYPTSGGGTLTTYRCLRGGVAVGVLGLAACSGAAPLTWTNCRPPQRCDETAVLDRVAMQDILDADGKSLGSGGADRGTFDAASRLLLTPGTYTILSYHHDEQGWTVRRQDTFAVEAGHRYQGNRRSCFGWLTFASPWCKEDRSDATTLWIEDLASSRVVAGAKWCRDDSDCPLSNCAKEGGSPLGACAIAGLECKSAPILYWSGALVGETGRCGPVAPDGRTNDWPGFPNFEPAAAPDSAHGLVYVYSPQGQVAPPYDIRVGAIGAPARVVQLEQGGYVPFYAPPGPLTLVADDGRGREPRPSVTLEVVAGETHYVRGVQGHHWLNGLFVALAVVGPGEALAELKRCRPVRADEPPANSSPAGH